MRSPTDILITQATTDNGIKRPNFNNIQEKNAKDEIKKKKFRIKHNDNIRESLDKRFNVTGNE